MKISTKRLKARLQGAKSEPSTWVGLGLIVGVLTGIPPAVVTAAGQAAVAGDWVSFATTVLPWAIPLAAGAAGVALPEKGKRDVAAGE